MNKRWLVASATGITIVIVYLVLAFMLNTEPQSDFYRTEDVPASLPGQRILVFTPHPDDESIAVGGYIYSCQQAGAQVEVILVTDGNHQGLRDKRYQEFKNAINRLGVADTNVQFWGYPDSNLSAHFEQVTVQIREEMASFQPEIVVYSDPEDRHPDHAALGAAVEKVLSEEQKMVRPIGYAYLVHYKYYPEPGMLTRRHYLLPPKSAVHTDETWQKLALSPEAQAAKYQAIHCYSSQLRNPFLKPLFVGLMRANELLARREF